MRLLRMYSPVLRVAQWLGSRQLLITLNDPRLLFLKLDFQLCDGNTLEAPNGAALAPQKYVKPNGT